MNTYNFKYHRIRRGKHEWKLMLWLYFEIRFAEAIARSSILQLLIGAEFGVHGGKWSKYLANLKYSERSLRLPVCEKFFQNGAIYRECGRAVQLYSLAKIIRLKRFYFGQLKHKTRDIFFQGGKSTANGFTLVLGQLVNQEKQVFQLSFFLKNVPNGLTVWDPNYPI